MADNVTWDQSELDKAIIERVKLVGRTAAEVVNTAAYWIAVNTKNFMPHSSTGRIEADLMATVKPGVFKSGKAKKTKKTTSFGTKAGDGLPLAYLIVLSRGANGYSGAWKKDMAALKGSSKSEFMKNLQRASMRMLKAKRKSIKFFKLGWIPAIHALKPYAVNKSRPGGGSPAEPGALRLRNFGSATPAMEGFFVYAVIENNIGTHGGPLAKEHNESLQAIGVPALQKAIDIEARLMNEYTAKALEKGDAEFNARCR